MHSSRKFLAAVAVSALGMLAAAAPALAADGKALFSAKGCVACHGVEARKPTLPTYPKLAGQNADYVFQQLTDIKNGQRTNGQAVQVMKPIVAKISDEDLRTLADYLGSLGPFAPATAQGPAGPGKQLFMTKTCFACHGKEGNKPVLKTYPFTAGQNKGYLLQQMKDIKSGKRTNGAVAAMAPVMHLVADEDMPAIADYLSNVK